MSLPDANDLWEHVERDGATYVRHRNGVRITWRTKHGRRLDDDEERIRGDIHDQSRTSRHRAAYAFGNAECTWLAMILLTWPRDCPPSSSDVKRCLRALRTLWRARWLEPMDGWLMEMHASGVPHFHLFIARGSEFGKICEAAPTREVKRRGRKTIIIGGSAERWLVGAWLGIIGQLGNADALAFNRGGIIERVRSHDAAGRYVAKECSKRQQKLLPDCYSEGLGRWWWLNKRWQERPLEEGCVDPSAYPFAGPMKHVWQSKDIQTALIAKQPPVPLPATGRVYVLRRNAPTHPKALSILAAAAGVSVIVPPAAPELPGLEKMKTRRFQG